MPLQQDLSRSPYFDDFNEEKDFYKILFKPGVAVQTRELNQLQTILQKQVERFGDNIFRRGTIIEGCHLDFIDSFPYVKINDIQTDGESVRVSSYEGLHVKNNANLVALVITSLPGYETRNPDLNTLYLKYVNSGSSANDVAFATGQTLTIYNQSDIVQKINVYDAASGFSNNDAVVIMSAIAVQNSTGGSVFATGFYPGDRLYNGAGANVTIVEVDTTSNTDVAILRVKPLSTNLNVGNSALWTLEANSSIINANTGQTANLHSFIGSGAAGVMSTDAIGSISSISVVSSGSSYTTTPTVSISSSSANTGQISQANLVAQTYLAQVTVANSITNPVGFGYGSTVTGGVIYQKGYFSRVEDQLIIVEKYSNEPDGLAIGFNTVEDIVDSDVDDSLFDNAIGTSNRNAPGADRLKLTPELTVISKNEADANSEFFAIAEISEGRVYKQNRQTQYNLIADEIAKRTYEESGNYVVDPFTVISKSDTVFANEANTFNLAVDPGIAYINGHRVETTDTYSMDVRKGVDVFSSNTSTISLNYGNYLRVKEVGGQFPFSTGESIELYDTAKTYLTSSAGATITTAGTKIGDARVRSFLVESGTPGTPNAVYSAYLFDIKMSAGKNFKNVKSIYYNSTYKGIADAVTEYNATNGLYEATLRDNNLSAMTFYAGVDAVKDSNTISYIYRTTVTGAANTSGYTARSLSAGESYPYPLTLTSADASEIIYVPLANTGHTANVAGSVVANTTSQTVVGTSTSFVSALVAGDYVKIANSTANFIGRVESVANNTQLTLSANGTSAITGNVSIYFPQNIPIDLSRTGRTVTTSANGSVMTISVGAAVSPQVNVAITYNARIANVDPVVKTVHRNMYTRIKTSNNAANTKGPWCLGVSDVFRLRGVFKANNASTTLSFDAGLNVSSADDFITLTNNPFANGDQVTYISANGTTISGLTNNTVYFVVSANTSGVKLANTSGGSTIDIAVGTNNQIKTLAGLPTYFGENTCGVSDATNDYYIDHNQTEDYYGLSYLYVKPRRATPSNNDILLVKYDMFTSTDGLKTMGRTYVADDSLTLSQLDITSGSVNTVEIPEFYGVKGNYFDLRDQFDFRPISNSTIAISNNHSTAAFNPIEPVANVRFTATDKKFPLPGTDLTCKINYFVGRNDIVVVDPESGVRVVSGIPGSNTAPAPLNDSILLSRVNVPAYPTLPTVLSTNMALLIDTKVANEKYSRQRISKYSVTTPISESEKAKFQTRGYTMKDIASLENRISNLEYYVSFTLAETLAKNRTIPSKVTPSINRFKFGFVVDNFDDYSFADTNNPEYKAVIKDGFLTAENHIDYNTKFKFNTANTSSTAMITGDMATLPYAEATVVSQLTATNGNTSVANTTSNGVSTSSTLEIVSAQYRSEYSTVQIIVDADYDEYQFTPINESAPVELYIGLSSWGDLNTSVQIFYGDTDDFSTDSLVAYKDTTHLVDIDPNTDIDKVPANVGVNWLKTSAGTFKPLTAVTYMGSPAIPVRSGTGKLSWTHSPALGKYIKVRVTRFHRAQSVFRIWMPVRSWVIQSASSPVNFAPGFVGTIIPLSTQRLKHSPIEARKTSSGDHTYHTTGTVIEFDVSGLKPLTTHKLYYDGVEVPITQVEETFGKILATDSSGYMNVKFYLPTTNDEVDRQTDLINTLDSSGNQTSNKVIRLEGSFLDKSSVAEITVYSKKVYNGN